MTLLVAFFGAITLALGALGVARPATMMKLVDRPWQSRNAIAFASLSRLVLGALLIVAADETRFPGVITSLGVLSIAGAVAIPMLGFELMRRFVDWWLARPQAFIRAWGLLAGAFGGFLIYAAL